MLAKMKQKETPKSFPKPELETIPPDLAKQMLAGNKNNRPLMQKLVKFYAHQMETGKWQLNGDTIRLDKNGYVLDGQHRLSAIVESGIPLTTYVLRGLDKDVFKTIDCGKGRTPADFLHIEGFGKKGVNLKNLAACAKIVMNFNKETGEYEQGNKGRMSPTELIQFVDNHSGLVQSSLIGMNFRSLCSPSIAGGLHYVFSIVNPDKANDFFDGLLTGEGLTKGNPILTVRNRLMTIRNQTGGAGGSYQRMMVGYLVQAFASYLKGERRDQSVYLSLSKIVLDEFAGAMR